MPEVSIVIVNYNTREPLRRCLESIRAQRGTLDVEVIVVDNGSRDGSPDMIRAVMPEAILIEPGRNTWFSGGNNIGIFRAVGSYTWILNADTVLQAGTLQIMLSYLKAHPRLSAVTCQMRFPDGRVQRTTSRIPRYIDLLFSYTVIGLLLKPWRHRRQAAMWFDGWERDSTRAVEIAPGSNILARTALLQQIGGFDETLKLYYTEDDLCRRLLAEGEIHFVAEALLIHEERASVKQVRRLASQIYFEDMLRYTAKYDRAARAALLRALLWPTRQAMDLAQRLRGHRQSL